MRKRLSSKLLAVILTIAICATTVFGCLMTVSAAESCYSFGDGKFNGDDLTQATIDVTFTAPASLPNGFAAGAFAFSEVDADGEDYLIFKDVTSNDVNVSVEGNYVVFDGEAVNTAKFTFTVGFSTGAATDKTYQVALSEVELVFNDAEYYIETVTGPVGEITAACKHVIGVVGTPDVKNEANNYSVYKESVCTKCGETFGYQLVPTADENELVNADGNSAPVGTTDTLEFGSYLTGMGSTSTYYDTVTADNGESGDSWDDPIIIDSAEEFVYIAKTGTNDTAGKYYKVADGIAAFDLSGGLVNPNGSLADELANIQASGKNHSGATPGFQGNFDGNGVTVYGAWCSNTSVSQYAGLFSCTQGDVTIKNVNVKLSSFTAKQAVGGIVGYHKGDGTNTLTIENCSVTDCHFELTGTGYTYGIGALVGLSSNLSSYTDTNDTDSDDNTAETIYVNGECLVNNCYANIDPDYFVSATKPGVLTDTTVRGTFGGVVGFMTSNGLAVDKCVVIGVTPYAVSVCTTQNDVQHMGLESHFTNVYTDQPSGSAVSIGGSSLGTRNFTGRVTQLSLANMKGSAGVVNMPKLDWGTTWVMDGTNTYPRLALPGETSDIISWDGTTATGISEGSGTKDDPYIINTAAELAYIVSRPVANYADTDGKYFKVADGIKSIVLQPYAYRHDIMALESAAETKTFFESGSGFNSWKIGSWEGTSFCGNIDFNGATVYGAYIKDSAYNAALICNIDAGAVISNLALKNSYFTSAAGNYQVGAIAAVTNGASYGKATNGFIWFDTCTVANNYLYNSSTSGDRSGVFAGASSDIIYIDNCLTYGNDATYGSSVTMPILGSANNGVLVSSAPAIPDGLTVVDDGAETARYYNMVRNSVILGTYPYDSTQSVTGARFNEYRCYSNVYTDMDVTALKAADEQIKTISAADALGSGAADAMPNLTWGTDWYCSAEGEYPVQTVFATFGTSVVSNANLELIGHNTIYNNDGSVDLNFHFVPKAAGATPVLYVGTLDGTRFMKVNATTSSLTDQLGENALMYTLPNLSARDIDLVWLPTLVNDGSALKEWGKSEQLALADNARAIIAGDYDTADKNVAAALLNYGNASDAALNVSAPDYNPGTYDLLEFGDYLTEAGSTSKYWDTVVADNGETGADWDNAIIIDNAEELVYLCKGSGNETAGKYYKVADGIAGFNLSNNNLDITKSYKANESIIKNSGKNHSGGQPGFQGHFDGNGATVYGAVINSNTYAGLFSCTKGDVTIKNINVKLSRFVGTVAAGGIVGYHEMTVNTTEAKNATTSSSALVLPELGTLTIENCSVTDCYLESTGTGYGAGTGAILGYEANSWADNNITYAADYVDASSIIGSGTSAYYDVDGSGGNTYYNGRWDIKNCYVNLESENFVSAMSSESSVRALHGGVAAFANTNGDTTAQGANVRNCIVIGVTPYATTDNTTTTDVQHTGLEQHFENVYTDQLSGSSVTVGKYTGRNFTGRVTQLTDAQLTGLGADANMPALDWNTVWTTTSGYPTFINKNYETPASGYAIYWDGTNTKTAPTVGSGTKDDPYIISTVAEFAYITGQGRDNYAITLGKYYKIADGITSIVMQPEEYAADIMALGSSAEVKAYYEANAANLKQWLYYGWEGSTFCGNIDFNGATVYGIYQVSATNAGLISNVDGGAVISNLSIRNSYIVSQSPSANYQAGAIAACTNGATYGQKVNGFIWFNNCIVANNYMYNNSTSHDRSGVIIGASGDIVYMDNCLTYGNDATYGDGVIMPVWSGANNSVLVSSAPTIPDGLTVETDGAATPRYRNKIRNSMFFGTYPYDQVQGVGSRFNDPNCYNNVYTDMSAVTTFFSGIAENKIAVVTADKALGAAAKTNMPNLDWDIWYVGAEGDMPNLKPAGDMPLTAQTLYNAMVLDTADDYGDSVDGFGVYAPGLNLKVNPYMTFTFVFGYEYARENIQVTFKSGDTVIETVTAADMINNEGAGRYHLYRLKSAPVTALATGITVSVSYNGGAAVDFGTYSAEGFAMLADNASKQQPCSYYATRYEAAKALLFYAQMLDARYGA